MHINCPHCQNPIEVVEESPPNEVVCPSCGSSIQLNPSRTATFLPTTSPRRVGKFEFLEELGVGAFGTVYKARDTELDRFVAIKVPRAGNLATKDDIDRFLREARTAAQLKHPSIVAVHDAAQVDGSCYLVSELVHGTTLADRLATKRLSLRESAMLVAEIADALDYAHRQGVIHRDLKPSNIMLDLDGKPHVMDFGLAKRDAGEITMTLDGQVLGTPAYMSPEQARGEGHDVDPRCDVYSLGVILYELITGELPFRGNKRMLIVQVLQDEPRPPRRINDSIPRDLETICLKAMAKQPTRRYTTARDLADDLRRYLHGEPILARPVGPGERLWTFAKRRPAVAALVGVSSAAVLSLLLGSLYYNARLSEALRKEEEHQARAEVNFQKARDAVDRMLTQVGENKDLEGIPLWQEHRQKFLKDALEFHQGFLKESDDPAVRFETGRAYQRTGRIYHMLGNRQEAINAYQQAIVVQKKLVDEFLQLPDYARELALSYNQLGFLYASGQKMKEAEEPHLEALRLRQRLAQDYPQNTDYQQDLAVTYKDLGWLYSITGRREQAETTLKEATDILERLVREHAGEIRFHISLAAACETRAGLLRENGNLEGALAWYTLGVQTLEVGVLKREPQSIEAKVDLSSLLMGRAEALLRLRRESEGRMDRERMAELGVGQSHVDLRVRRAMALAYLGQYALAVAEIQAMRANGQEPMQAGYNFACVYSLASAAARSDAQLSEPEQERISLEYAQRAIDLLRKARGTGFYTPDIVSYLKMDTDLAPLRLREDFNILVQELEQDLKDGGTQSSASAREIR